MNIAIDKPIKRSRLRHVLAREFFTTKRRLQWLTQNTKFSRKTKSESLPFVVFEHKSVVLRPLKDVDMKLQQNKRTNLSIAIRSINGIVIAPGETFSLWKLVGRPRRSKGYLEGLTLSRGQISTGVGGGLCQLGNLLFWIFMHSPLSIVERHRHSYDVFPDINRKVPFGAGATLVYNYIDLQVKNNTDHYFQLFLWLDEVNLNGRLHTDVQLQKLFRVEEKYHFFRQEPWGGYSRHNQIVRIESNLNTQSEEETFWVENHALLMYRPFLESTNY
ncbi:MAG: vancomycin resistance protein [Bacteroidetes bacterium HGW-Bacteroidetes-6]|jgi:vancomycin resistance protein VanW|nr:MAG: vancomycin resistance protein [Bacteroidetes bacterium HGW-Bacteroidetes-6]